MVPVLPFVIAALLIPATANSASAHPSPHLFPQNGRWSLCLDVEGGGGDMARVIQWQCNHQPNQAMQFVHAGTEAGRNYFQIRTERGCLDVEAASFSNGAKIQQYTCIPGQRNQHWFIDLMWGGTYAYQVRHSGKCLDVPSGTTQTWPIVQMQQYTCNFTSAQNFWWAA